MFQTLFEIEKDLSGTTEVYSKELDLKSIGGNNVEASFRVNSITGGGDITVIPQYSYDELEWIDDQNVFTPVSGASDFETKTMKHTGTAVRFKYVLTGTTPTANITLYARASVGGSGESGSPGGGGPATSVEITHPLINDGSNDYVLTQEKNSQDISDKLNDIEVATGTVKACVNSSSGEATATNSVNGNEILSANANRAFAEFTNTGNEDAYYRGGVTVDNTAQVILPGQTKVWNSQEALRVIASSTSVVIKYIDYLNA